MSLFIRPNMHNKPWAFIETGVMTGGISLKGTKVSALKAASQMVKHHEQTPLFVEAVQVHNKSLTDKLKAERKKKNELRTV